MADAQLSLSNVIVGAVVSKIIVFVTSSVVFPSSSLNLIYTVFSPSPLGNVKLILELHVSQLSGLAPVPYATSIVHSHASGHVVSSVTVVEVVYVALSLILNSHHVGAVL